MSSSLPVIYLDVLLAAIGANFLFDWLLLWATAEVTKTPTTRLRLLGGTLCGSLHYALYLLATYGLIGAYGFLRFPGTVGLVSLAMLAVAFAPQVTARSFFRLAGTFYVILFVSSGAGLALGSLLAYGGQASPVIVQLGAALALLFVAEIGWGIVQRRIWREQYLVPLEITFDGQRVRLTALVDTGNSLTDPITRSPVIVAELGPMRPLFPESVRDDLDELVRGDFGRISGLMIHSEWSARLRLIPFTSLGAESGLLVGFTPDRVRLLRPKAIEISRRVVVGLAPQTLDPAGEYHALLHPELLDGADHVAETNLGKGDAEPQPVEVQSN